VRDLAGSRGCRVAEPHRRQLVAEAAEDAVLAAVAQEVAAHGAVRHVAERLPARRQSSCTSNAAAFCSAPTILLVLRASRGTGCQPAASAKHVHLQNAGICFYHSSFQSPVRWVRYETCWTHRVEAPLQTLPDTQQVIEGLG